MWLELIQQLDPNCKTHPPLSEEWIDKGLADLGVTLNDDLKSFLLETDGLYDYKQFLWMVWNVRDLSAYNLAMRNDEKFANRGYTFEDMFFIANHGEGGILYGLPIVDRVVQASVLRWYSDTNDRIQVADNLKQYLEQWIQGKF